MINKGGRFEHEQKVNNNIENILLNLPETVSEWNGNLEASGNTAATRLIFVRIIARFFSFIKAKELSDITFASVQKYIISIKKSSQSDSYQQQVWCCLNNFFSFLLKRKYINENPMDSIEKCKNHDLDRINEHRILLTEDDFNNILNSVKTGVGSNSAQMRQIRFRNRDLLIMLLFMITGMRKTALSEINISDINFEKETLRVIDKGDKLQIYYLNYDIIKIIRNWIFDRRELNLIDSDALFVSYQGKRLSGTAIDKIVAKYCEDALGYKISPHKLRAGFVSIYYNKTKDIEATRRAVGHSNVATTQRYIVTNNSERKDASDYISKSLNF